MPSFMYVCTSIFDRATFTKVVSTMYLLPPAWPKNEGNNCNHPGSIGCREAPKTTNTHSKWCCCYFSFPDPFQRRWPLLMPYRPVPHQRQLEFRLLVRPLVHNLHAANGDRGRTPAHRSHRHRITYRPNSCFQISFTGRRLDGMIFILQFYEFAAEDATKHENKFDSSYLVCESAVQAEWRRLQTSKQSLAFSRSLCLSQHLRTTVIASRWIWRRSPQCIRASDSTMWPTDCCC